MIKKKLKLKSAKPFNFAGIIAPFKDENNQKIFAAVLMLLYLSFFSGKQMIV